MSKKANYTPEQAAQLVEAYSEADTQEQREHVVMQYAALYGKPLQSIRAKLVSEGVYVKKEYQTKTGDKPEAKSAIVADIANFLGVSVEVVESLEKANKRALDLIRGTFARLPQD